MLSSFCAPSAFGGEARISESALAQEANQCRTRRL
jgi:hypothetical protein